MGGEVGRGGAAVTEQAGAPDHAAAVVAAAGGTDADTTTPLPVYPAAARLRIWLAAVTAATVLMAAACGLVAALTSPADWLVALLWSVAGVAVMAGTVAAVRLSFGAFEGVGVAGILVAEAVIAGLVVLFVKAPDFYPPLPPVTDATLQAARETARASRGSAGCAPPRWPGWWGWPLLGVWRSTPSTHGSHCRISSSPARARTPRSRPRSRPLAMPSPTGGSPPRARSPTATPRPSSCSATTTSRCASVAIYALERVARDSADDQATVVEVLSRVRPTSPTQLSRRRSRQRGTGP